MRKRVSCRWGGLITRIAEEDRQKWREEIHLTANHLAEDILDVLQTTEIELLLVQELLRRCAQGDFNAQWAARVYDTPAYAGIWSDKSREYINEIRRELESKNG